MKIKNNQSGIAHVAVIIIILIVIMVIGFVGWKIYASNDAAVPKTEKSVSNKSSAETKYVMINEWGVKFPASQVGNFSAVTSSETASVGPMSPEGLEDKPILVEGFTEANNRCVLPFESTKIYQHKEEDPEIQYTTTFKLSTIAPTKVKVGNYWYSLVEPTTSGSCFEGKTVPDDYKELVTKIVQNFKKLEQL